VRRFRADLDPLELARLAPAAGVMAVWTFLMFRSGGFSPETWLPAGLVLLGLLFVSIVGLGRVLPAARPARLALAALAGFTAWCFASMVWSDAPGDTWEAADLLLVTLLGAWTLALTPWRPKTAWVLLMTFSIAAAVACLIGLMSALGASDLTSRFEDLRFSPPLDYPNSTSAFALMAALPALLQAARPDSSIPAKAFGQGLCMFLCAYALLPQSRGAVLGGLAALAVLAIAVTFRWRLALHAGVVLIGLVVVAGPVGDVYTAAATTGEVSEALSQATTAILAATLFAGLTGAGLDFAQTRVVLDDNGRRSARLAGFGVTGLATAAIVAAAALNAGTISDTVSDQWRSLSNPGVEFAGAEANDAGNRLASVDPLERYDYWRVSVAALGDAPLWGDGAGAFRHRYTLERRYPKVTRYPHNVALKVAGDTGLIGVGLMGAFVVLAAIGLLRARRSPSRTERVVAAAALSMLAYFTAHGLFDWLEAYPVLTGPALAFPLVALVAIGRGRMSRGEKAREAASPRASGLSVPVLVAVGGATVLAAGSLVAPWLSLRYRERASDAWRTAPGQAYVDLDRAAGIDPLSVDAPILQGVIALTRGELIPARAGFTEALTREEDWLAHFGLAVVAAAEGDEVTAREEIRVARSLNDIDPQLREVSKRVLAGGEVDTAQLIRDVLVSPFITVERLS